MEQLTGRLKLEYLPLCLTGLIAIEEALNLVDPPYTATPNCRIPAMTIGLGVSVPTQEIPSVEQLQRILKAYSLVLER